MLGRAAGTTAPQRRLRLLGRLRPVGSERGGIVHVERLDVRPIEAAQLVDEDPAHHAQEPAVRLVQLLHLVEPRVGPSADLLDQILGVMDGPREPIGRPIKELVMPADQRLESLYGRSTSGNDGQSGHRELNDLPR